MCMGSYINPVLTIRYQTIFEKNFSFILVASFGYFCKLSYGLLSTFSKYLYCTLHKSQYHRLPLWIMYINFYKTNLWLIKLFNLCNQKFVRSQNILIQVFICYHLHQKGRFLLIIKRILFLMPKYQLLC